MRKEDLGDENPISDTSQTNSDGQYKKSFNHISLILIVGLISSFCVLSNLVFQKPYEPAIIAQEFNNSDREIMLVLNYKDTNEIAFSLSYADAFSNVRPPNSTTGITIFDYNQGSDQVWSKLSKINAKPHFLWIVAPGLVFKTYPQQIVFENGIKCSIDPDEYHRLGFPYQGYNCR